MYSAVCSNILFKGCTAGGLDPNCITRFMVPRTHKVFLTKQLYPINARPRPRFLVRASLSSPAASKVGVALSRLFGAKGSGGIFGEERPDGHDGGADYGCVDLKYRPYDWVHVDP